VKTPKEIVDLMMENDEFSRLLGIKIFQLSEGACELSLTIEKKHLNGFGITHGGVTFSFADTCLAFAANTFGQKAVSIETSIAHLKKVSIGDVLSAKSELISKGKKVGVYLIHVFNQDQDRVALFKGHVNFSSDFW
jgi:acyl-CoA thioesterase